MTYYSIWGSRSFKPLIMENWTKQDIKNLNKKEGFKKRNRNLLGELEIDKKYIDDQDSVDFDLVEEAIEKGKGFFVPINTPSKKNRYQIVAKNNGKSICCDAPYEKLEVKRYRCTDCGLVSNKLGKMYSLAYDKKVEKFIGDVNNELIRFKARFLKLVKEKDIKYYRIGYYFVRDSARTWDYDNNMQTMGDIFQLAGFIPDDAARVHAPYPIGYHIDPKEPGVYFILIKRPKFELI